MPKINVPGKADPKYFMMRLQKWSKKIDEKNKEKVEKAKEDLKDKIRQKLEYINNQADNLVQVDKLQKLNQKFQLLLTDESKTRN